jgi:hypothetical protein
MRAACLYTRRRGGANVDYKLGLTQLRKLIEQRAPDALAEFATLEARWHANDQSSRIMGPSENTRHEGALITYALNTLALKYSGISFTDLCLGKHPPGPPPPAPPDSKGDGEMPAPGPVLGTGNRWAILVGVNGYDDALNYGPLDVCVKDVEAVRDRLIAGGFDAKRVRLLTDHTPELPTRDNILVALKAIADNTEPGDLLLFYYSGHGDAANGASYLVGRNGRRLVLSDTAIRVSRIKEFVQDAPARAKVIILDACHSGANIGGKGPAPMSEEFIRRVFEEAEGLAILASCKQGQLSYEWKAQERSVFTHYLLEALEGQADRDGKRFVTVQDASRHVTNGVKLWASRNNTSQTPTLQYTMAGDIILVQLGL